MPPHLRAELESNPTDRTEMGAEMGGQPGWQRDGTIDGQHLEHGRPGSDSPTPGGNSRLDDAYALWQSGVNTVKDHPLASIAAGGALAGTAALLVVSRGRVLRTLANGVDDLARTVSGYGNRFGVLEGKFAIRGVSGEKEIAYLQRISDKLPGLNSNLWKWVDVKGDLRVATVGRRPVGFVAFEQTPKTYGEVHIGYLGVDPKFQRMGIGKKLMESVVRQDSGEANIVALTVRERNQSAISLYEGMGFKEFKRLPNFYGAPSDNGIAMYKELRPNGFQEYLSRKARILAVREA